MTHGDVVTHVVAPGYVIAHGDVQVTHGDVVYRADGGDSWRCDDSCRCGETWRCGVSCRCGDSWRRFGSLRFND